MRSRIQGIALLTLIPQLLNGTASDKKFFCVALLAISAYIAFPFFRYFAMGFAVPYFRTSTLWVSMALLVLAGRAVSTIFNKGLSLRILVYSMLAYILILGVVCFGDYGPFVSLSHVKKILFLLFLSGTLLTIFYFRLLPLQLLPLLLIMLIMIESVLIARPSFIEGRALVLPEFHKHAYNDNSMEALDLIRSVDPGVFRIEKTFNSVSLADSRAQEYMGIKSYSLHSKGMVDFFISMGLISQPNKDLAVNYTNWLPNAGSRFVINSLVGVKYILSREVLQWPGFDEVARGSNLWIYRNQMALPFGYVQQKQVLQETFSALTGDVSENANLIRDLALMNAVVVRSFVPGHGTLLNYDEVVKLTTQSLNTAYVEPATNLQKAGLIIDKFSSGHISGSIRPDRPGILVFSIPFNRGWSLKLNGTPTQLQVANFGMLAAPVPAGVHQVTLDYELPGRRIGFYWGVFGLFILGFFKLRSKNFSVSSKKQLI